MSIQENGWITEEIFFEWVDHFKQHVRGGVSRDNKQILLLDGYGSHVTLDVVTKAANYGIDIALLRSHTIHKLQPLDVSVFKSFKYNFAKQRVSQTYTSYYIRRPLKLVYNILYNILEVFN